MSKATQPTAVPSIEEILAKAKASMTPDQLAALNAIAGAAKSGGDGIPKLHRNAQERKDANGKRIVKGNWVIGQKVTKQGEKNTLDEAGTDLGENIDIEIVLIAQQYSFFSNAPNERCSSPIFFDREGAKTATGFKLGHVCSSGKCPRRNKELKKEDRCSVQWIVYVKLPAGSKLPDGTDCPVAKVFIGGDNYMPFKEYLETLSGMPASAFITRVTGEEKVHGAVLYFVNQYAPIAQVADVMANLKLGEDIKAKLEASAAERKASAQTPAPNQPAAQAPAAPQAPVVSDAPNWDAPGFNPDDDIPF